MSKVSIVIPIYNDELYIRDTLNSIQCQSCADWTCVLVNDGSTDSTQSIIEEYKRADKRFVSFVIPNSGSADYPIEYGMEKVNSPFCVVLGHDDVLAPDFLEIQLQRQKETNADIVSPTMVFCARDLEGEIWRLPCDPIKYTDIITGVEAVAYTIRGWKFAANGMLYRTELNDGVVRGRYMNSDEFSARQILYKADKVAFSEAIYIYRQHGESISRKISPRLWERLYVDRQIEDFILEKYSQDESVCAKAVSSTFFNLVYLTYEGFTLQINVDRKNRQKIRESIKYNFNQLNAERMQRYLPKHYRMFMKYGYEWYCVMSVLYHVCRKMRGMKPYECQ